MMYWCLNISILLKEHAFLDRFAAAADLGFTAVECWWPTGIDLDAMIVARERAGVRVALLNADAGDLAAGERGYLGNPAKTTYLEQNFRHALDLAEALGCRMVHVLGGNAVPGMSREAQIALVTEQQRQLCALAALRGFTVTLEPQNPFDTPRYLFHTSAQALAQIAQVGAANLKLQYDVYHMQRTEGNIVNTLRQHAGPGGAIAHIQVADVPGRNQPGTGELNFPFIFRALQQIGYSGFVSLEYNAPGGDTRASLDWLPASRRGVLEGF